MTAQHRLPIVVYDLIDYLRRRGLPLGIDDCDAFRRALLAGHGWSSSEELLRVCVALWAKSDAEAELITAAWTRLRLPRWEVTWPVQGASGVAPAESPQFLPGGGAAETMDAPSGESEPFAVSVKPSPRPRNVVAVSDAPMLPPSTGRHDRSLMVAAQYPSTEREVVQTWRRLRRVVRQGPPVEVDIDATLREAWRTGVMVAPMLVPARRNTAKLMLLVDRTGSMTPFHGYVDHVVGSIRRAGRLDAMTVGYFRNTAGDSDQHRLLHRLPDPFAASIDPILPIIGPMVGGQIYRDVSLTDQVALSEILDLLSPSTAVAVISDAGAGRGRLRIERLLDSVALVKAIRARTPLIAWLNPLPPERWVGNTAAQIARHVPMFPLTRGGMQDAVEVFRGRPVELERPL